LWNNFWDGLRFPNNLLPLKRGCQEQKDATKESDPNCKSFVAPVINADGNANDDGPQNGEPENGNFHTISFHVRQ
jgi:hypothetical protein